MKYTINITTKELQGLYTLEALAKRPNATVSIVDRELAVVVAKKIIDVVEAGVLVKNMPDRVSPCVLDRSGGPFRSK